MHAITQNLSIKLNVYAYIYYNVTILFTHTLFSHKKLCHILSQSEIKIFEFEFERATWHKSYSATAPIDFVLGGKIENVGQSNYSNNANVEWQQTPIRYIWSHKNGILARSAIKLGYEDNRVSILTPFSLLGKLLRAKTSVPLHCPIFMQYRKCFCHQMWLKIEQ